MQVLALISIYAPVVIVVIAVIAVVSSFFWVFVPVPHWLPRGMSLLIWWRRWRDQLRRCQ
jgi:hypothetical protein